MSATIVFPPADREPWPTLGPALCAWIEEFLCHGPGDLIGQPVELNAEQRAWIYRCYEVYPAKTERRKNRVIVRSGHPQAGRRRFQRCAISLRKGSSKTELAAWIAAAELHQDAPVRCVGWLKSRGVLVPDGAGVVDPYIPMISYTEEQTAELAYGALRRILEEMPIGHDFDIGIERIMRRNGDGKAEAVSASPNARDGARTTFQHADEALALDTPLPTPDGWTTMREVQIGDLLVGRNGARCRVIGKSPVHQSRRCYRVTFEDGSSVVADAGHLWFARRRGGCGHGQGCRCPVTQGWAVRRTDSLRDVTVKGAARRTYTYHVPMGEAFRTEDVELPVNPYVLGLWLGDGDARNAMIHAGFIDSAEIAAAIRNCGYVVTEGRQRTAARMYVTTPDSRTGRFGDSVVGRLRRLSVLQDKHIPARYLRAGTEQRLSLMQGLMDSDGHVSTRGCCTFVNTNGALIEGFVELARSLGFAPSVTWREDDRKQSYRRVAKVTFQADTATPVFRLERKRARLQHHRHSRQLVLAVVSVEEVPSVPVQCVAVDAPDALYRAGTGMIVTHNTHRFTLESLRRAWTVMRANLSKRPLADPWALETTTAPEPGAGSVAEETMEYAAQLAEKKQDGKLFFFHRQASDKHDLDTERGLRAAVVEASGPFIAKWAPIDRIVEAFREPDADRAYLERVWLNRPVQASSVAFDVEQWGELVRPGYTVADGEAIALGFDGGRFEDDTALVGTELESGYQWLLGRWPAPVVPEDVDGVIRDVFERWQVALMYCDPPKWESWIATWASRHGEKRVREWWTNRRRPMAYAIRSYTGAIAAGDLSHADEPVLETHLANARRLYTNLVDEQGQKLWILRKERSDSPKKIDAAMAAVLSWEARNDALGAGAATGGWDFQPMTLEPAR